jgi:hypothetical protein
MYKILVFLFYTNICVVYSAQRFVCNPNKYVQSILADPQLNGQQAAGSSDAYAWIFPADGNFGQGPYSHFHFQTENIAPAGQPLFSRWRTWATIGATVRWGPDDQNVKTLHASLFYTCNINPPQFKFTANSKTDVQIKANTLAGVGSQFTVFWTQLMSKFETAMTRSMQGANACFCVNV